MVGLSRRRLVMNVVQILPLLLASRVVAEPSCSFSGNPIVELLPDGRTVRLQATFRFVDSANRTWIVPAGITSDGASIPQIFWSVIGGPFEGPYRAPAIVHDYFCLTRRRKSSDVHRMFYEAMLCAQVGPRKAMLMYEAVKRFGPSWADPPPRPAQCETVTPDYDFQLCTENSEPPSAEYHRIVRTDLDQFLSDMANVADPADLEELRRKRAALPE